MTGAAGNAFTTTVVVTAGDGQPFTVVIKLYVPAAAAVAEATVGFCTAYAVGPVHAYVAPADGVDVPVKFKALPTHIGPLFAAVAVGIALITTAVDDVELQPLSSTVVIYVPVAAVVGLAMSGFCTALVKLFGPVHENVAPAEFVALNCNGEPAHFGPSLLAVVVGTGFIVIVPLPA